MNKMKKWIVVVLGVAVLGGLTLGALAFGFTSTANAMSAAVPALSSDIGDLLHGRGGDLFPGRGADDGYLAEALGISTDDLQAAEENAYASFLDDAVALGLITQAQADWLSQSGSGSIKDFGRGLFGWLADSNDLDYESYLADALGISVDDLTAARQSASDARLAAAVDDGRLTQEQADMMQARQALAEYINPETLMTAALGITPEQLQAYRDEGLSTSEILAELGMTATEVRDAQQAAYENAIQQAVTDGVITQEQADEMLLSGGLRGFGDFGPGLDGPHGGRGGRGGHGGFGGPETMPVPETTAPTTDA
jgi:hypothetical protein